MIPLLTNDTPSGPQTSCSGAKGSLILPFFPPRRMHPFFEHSPSSFSTRIINYCRAPPFSPRPGAFVPPSPLQKGIVKHFSLPWAFSLNVFFFSFFPDVTKSLLLVRDSDLSSFCKFQFSPFSSQSSIGGAFFTGVGTHFSLSLPRTVRPLRLRCLFAYPATSFFSRILSTEDSGARGLFSVRSFSDLVGTPFLAVDPPLKISQIRTPF